MEELKTQIEVEQAKRHAIELAIQDNFAYERFPNHSDFVAMTEDFQRLSELNTVIKVLEETLSAFLSNTKDNHE